MKDALGRPQSVLVLGGTSEIGLAIARRLVARGAQRVVLAGRDVAALETAAASLGDGPAITAVRFDAADTGSHEAFASAVTGDGDIDVVVVAFGLHARSDQVDADIPRGVAIAQANYTGAVSVLLHLVPRLRAQGHGNVVVLSSVAGERGRADNYVYGSSKAGIDAFCQGLGDNLAGSGVTMTVVRPGYVHTKMTVDHTPAPFATTPEKVADDVIAGLDRQAHTVWSPGVLRWVFVVLRHLPRAIFRRLRPG